MSVTNLPLLQQEITRYGITTYFALGFLGSIFNCIIFTRHSYRRTPSSVYILALSIFAIIYLIWTAFPLIYTLDHLDPQTQSRVYCKARLYGSHTLGLYLRYTVVFACADRFLVTRTNVRLRSLSSVKTALILLAVMSVVCLLIAVHIPMYIDIRNGVCGMTGMYKLSYAIYQIIVISIIPPLLMSIFSILTIRSLRRRHDATQVRIKQRDRHLTHMVIAEVIANILASIPYSANLLYGAWTYSMTTRSAKRVEIESFISFVTQLLVYFLGIAPFYLFMLTSKPFRNQFIGLFTNFWSKHIMRRGQIVPLNNQNYSTTNNGRIIRERQ